jgi:hypothetical protein
VNLLLNKAEYFKCLAASYQYKKYEFVQQLQLVSVRLKLYSKKGKNVVYNRERIMFTMERNRYAHSLLLLVNIKMALKIK